MAHPVAPASRKSVALGLFIFSITLLVFMPVVGHSMLTWDDGDAIYQNPDYKPPVLDGLKSMWAHPMHGYHGLYVPVTYSVWWVAAHFAQRTDPQITGIVLDPRVFHALNVLFHALAAVMVFLILRRLVGADVPAALGTLLFALHPLQVEPVSWASTMYTPLSGFLALAAAWLYLVFSDARGSAGELSSADGPRAGARRWALFAAATLCFVLALLTKPTVVVMPVMVAVIEIVLRRKSIRSCLPLLVWLALGAADALITRDIQPGRFAYKPELLARPLIAFDALAFYMGKLVLPRNLMTDYGRSPLWVLLHRPAWLLSLIPLAALAFAFLQRRRAPWLLAGALVFVLGPAAMLGLVPFDFQHYSTVADRYAYLALFGAAIAAAYAIRAGQARGYRVPIPAAAALLLGLGWTARAQTAVWSDTETLFFHNADLNPTSIAANSSIGDLLFERGDAAARRRAVANSLAVIAQDIENPRIRMLMAEHLFREGRFADAAHLCRQAGYILLSEETPPRRSVMTYLDYMLGRCLMAMHDRPGAIAAFARAVRLTPDYCDADLRLADLLAETGRTTEAAARYRIILQAHPQARFVRDRLRRLQAEAGVDLR